MKSLLKKRETITKETKFDCFMQKKVLNLEVIRGGENPPPNIADDQNYAESEV